MRILKERQKELNQDNLTFQDREGEQAEVFNPGNQAVVNLTKEAQGTMHYKAQK